MSKPKRTYIPYMGDHSHIMAAALEAFDVPAEVLPPPDDESTKLGLDLVLGRECAPCMMTVGDVIRLARRPGFDPADAAVILPTAPGPCRFGQYAVLQRHLLDEHGLQQIEILSPSSGNAYRGLGDHPLRMRLLAWDGVVALDLLQQLVHRYRPYETVKGSADKLYTEGLEHVVSDIRNRRNRLVEVLDWCAEQFGMLEIDETEPRPLIGIVGEIYVRFSPYANQDLIRRIENLGGEVLLASMMEWLYLTTFNPGYYARMRGDFLGFLSSAATEKYQHRRERVLTRRIAHLLRHAYEKPTGELKDSVRKYLEPTIETEAVLTLGKAIDLAHHGVSGILAVMPFSCMPGILTAAIAPRLRVDLGNIPWLDVSFDLQKSTNIQTRLEAFISQSRHYRRRSLVA